jgi:murein DD-endopeptidase MepM/ murein hydrolase activator NlpD
MRIFLKNLLHSLPLNISMRCLLVSFFAFQVILFQQNAFADSKIEGKDSYQGAINKSALKTDVTFQPISPLSGSKNISSDFGMRRDPFNGLWSNHLGVDYPANKGTPILAIESGTVIQSNYIGRYGNLVEIDHGSGFTSKYGHASQLLVNVGQQVQQGEVIALVGSTGYSTGPHLHFEISQVGQVMSPSEFLKDGVQLIQSNQKFPLKVKQIPTRTISDSELSHTNFKQYFKQGEIVVAIRVRSGKALKW